MAQCFSWQRWQVLLTRRTPANHIFDIVVNTWPINYLASALFRLLLPQVTDAELKDQPPHCGRDDESAAVHDEAVVHSEMCVDGPVRPQLHWEVRLAVGETGGHSLM